jgi:muramoyltetrapeptide carboxypeptidase
MKRPAPLSPGDTIALAAPSRFATLDQVQEITRLLESRGYKVHIDEDVLARDFQFAGTDKQRAEVLNRLIHNNEIKAIWCMRGGYGAGRLLPHLDFEYLANHPKWVIGFSDITAIHSAMLKWGVACLHAPLATTLITSPSAVVDECFDLLEGRMSKSSFLHTAGMLELADSRIVGGNLSVLYSINGSPWLDIHEGDVLLIEDIDEMLYHIDRMMNNLLLSGVLAKLSGVLIGHFTAMRDSTQEFGFSTDNPFGKNAIEIIASYLAPLGIPYAIVPVGHESENYPIILG